MDANRTRSLGATARPAPQSAAGSSRLILEPAPAATEPALICMNDLRVREFIRCPLLRPSFSPELIALSAATNAMSRFFCVDAVWRFSADGSGDAKTSEYP